MTSELIYSKLFALILFISPWLPQLISFPVEAKIALFFISAIVLVKLAEYAYLELIDFIKERAQPSVVTNMMVGTFTELAKTGINQYLNPRQQSINRAHDD